MALHTYWVSGNTFQGEWPDQLEFVQPKGWGKVFCGEKDTNNWFHTSIAVPVLLKKKSIRPKLKRVYLLYQADLGLFETSGVQLWSAHLYDGGNKFIEFDLRDRNTFAEHTSIDEDNQFQVDSNLPELSISYFLGISLEVIFPNSPEWTHRCITFTAAGADFETFE